MFNCRLSLLVLLCSGWWSPALVEGQVYNPYARDVEEPPISKDGTIHWPPFFKSAYTEAKYQHFFQTGSCTGTKKSTVEMLKNNKVDVNQLPQASLTGKVRQLMPGIVGIVDISGKSFTVVTHPQGVSRIQVSGDSSQGAIRPGTSLRFTGSVDEHGHGVHVIDAIEIVTLSPDIQPIAVVPGHEQSIVANVSSRRKNLLHLHLSVGRLKSLSVTIAPDAKTIVNGASLDLLSLGDDVSVKGHVYSSPGTAADHTIFADDIIGKKSN